MKLSLGFSPCPNDTFIFDALVNGKIDTGEISFEPVLEDVETLNEWALEGRLDITKLSFPAFFRSTENYLLLNSGSALGNGVGPLLVTADPLRFNEGRIPGEVLETLTIVLPGENTTAHLLFSLAYPSAKNKIFLRFDQIEDYVLENPERVGVIIHENRFTYQEKGLHKIQDLGEFWESKMSLPIPLGGIAINQSVKRSVALAVDKMIRQSIEYAFRHYPSVSEYVKLHSQAMSEDVMIRHINLYVNDYSIDLGAKGKDAIGKMYQVFADLNDIDAEEREFLFI